MASFRPDASALPLRSLRGRLICWALARGRGSAGGYGVAIVTTRSSAISWMASRGPSRPKPLSLEPL
jgi:hypothetical protein